MIDEKQVHRIADLARLTLSDDEVERFSSELTGILDYIESLKKIDVKGIKPTAHAVDVDNVFRTDETLNAGVIEKLLPIAPQTEEGFFLVPKVL